MALDRATLVAALIALQNIEAEDNPNAYEQYANNLADAIDTYVKSGDVIVTGGSSSGTYPVT